MILASTQDIDKYETMGIWGTTTIINIFKKHVQRIPEQICIIDPLNNAGVNSIIYKPFTEEALGKAIKSFLTF